jgi:hypothetical protein
VADEAIVKDVGLGVEAITLEDKLKAAVERPVIVTVCPEENPWLFNVLYVTMEPEEEASLIVAERIE